MAKIIRLVKKTMGIRTKHCGPHWFIYHEL